MASKWGDNSSCCEYLENTSNLLKKEEERLEASISSKYNTGNKVLAEFNEKLIKKYKQNLINDNSILDMMENNHFKV